MSHVVAVVEVQDVLKVERTGFPGGKDGEGERCIPDDTGFGRGPPSLQFGNSLFQENTQFVPPAGLSPPP